MRPEDSAHDPADDLSDTYATARQPGPQARAPNGPPRLKSRLRGDAGKALAKQQSTGPAGAGPGRSTHFPRRAADAAAPIQSNDSERLPRSAGVRSSAGMPPDGQRHDDCRHGAFATKTRATSGLTCFPKMEEAWPGPASGRRGYDSSEIKGEENGGHGVNFRHTRSNEQTYGPLDMTKREQMTYFQLRTNLFSSFDLCVSCLIPELDHQLGV